MTLPNGLTVVLVPRPQFPSVTALLGFHGGSAALPPGVLEMVRVVEAHAAQDGTRPRWRSSRADGRGFTADFVRTDRRRLSNALYSLADRLKTVAETDWQGLLARAQATATPEDLRSHDEPRIVAAGRMLAALYGRHPYGHRVRRPGSAGARSVAGAAVAPAPLQSAQRLPRHRRRHRRQRRRVAGVGLVRELAGSGRRGPPDGAARAPPGTRPTRETGADHAPARSRARSRSRSPAVSRSRRAAASARRNECCRTCWAATCRRRSANRRARPIRSTARSSALPAGGAHLSVAMSVDTRRLRDALRVLHAELDALARADRERRCQPGPLGARDRGRARLPDRPQAPPARFSTRSRSASRWKRWRRTPTSSPA